MYPAVIEEYVRPTTVEDAVDVLGRYPGGEAIFLAGGQSVMQAIKSRMMRPRCVIDLQDISSLKGIAVNADGIRLGAMVRYVDIVRCAELPPAYAALRDAAQHVGDRQVRNRGTIGGSCCWNYLASCLPATVLALGGTMMLLRQDGHRREMAVDDFLIGPLETARGDDEILTAIHFKAATRTGSAYQKWGLLKDALPVVGVCVKVSLDGDGRCIAARISLSGLAAGAQRAPGGEIVLVGSAGETGIIEKAFAMIAEQVDAQSDQWANSAYRQQLIRTLGREVATRAFGRARGES